MKTINKFLLITLSLFVISACEDFINETDPLIDRVEDERLTSEAQVPFLITGIQQRFSVLASTVGCQADLLSDMLTYTNDNPNASFPQYEEIEIGNIALNNNTTTNTWDILNEFRYLADTLGIRISQIDFANPALKLEAQFTSNFYGGIARFWTATTYGLSENQPGGCYNAGPFVPAATMLDEALQKLKLAAEQTDATMRKVVNSIIAKVYFAKSDYANAATYAASGMASGDAAFNALNADNSQVYHWGFAGIGRPQITVAQRFQDYVAADPKEEARIPLNTIEGKTAGNIYYFQMKYAEKSSPYVVMTWQENHLMLAELALRGQGTGDALALVNEVRASHGLDPLASIDINGVLVEREKELFVQGTRLMDQHRTTNWHMTADAWHYLPIPQTERDANPNLD